MIVGVTSVSAGHGGGHLLHLLATAAFFVISIGGVALGELLQRQDGFGPRALKRPGAQCTAALASAGAAATHYVVMPEHFREATLYGVFFAVSATLQLSYAALILRRPSTALLAAGVAANVVMLYLWLMTRTIAVPLGPARGTTEPFGLLDVVCAAFEVVLVVASLLVLLHPEQHGRSEPAAIAVTAR